MFKKFFITMLLLISSMVAFSQVYTYRSYAFSEKKVGYAWSNTVNSNLTITINLDSDVIRIYNKLNSTFLVQTSQQYYDNDGEWTLKCNCRDEEGLRCTIRLIIRNSGTSQMYVDYNNVTWCFNILRTN